MKFVQLAKEVELKGIKIIIPVFPEETGFKITIDQNGFICIWQSVYEFELEAKYGNWNLSDFDDVHVDSWWFGKLIDLDEDFDYKKEIYEF
ncbi:hypothetical protein HPMBJEAJ_00425 [Aeromonas phage avDM6]|nr:hypothetical protein HPMBJEAJ_00425 [Aeromonas phage avDM6]